MSTTPTTGAAVSTASEQEALRKAIASGTRPPRASAFAACRAFAWRGILKIKHVPEQLMDATITPVLFTLMFTYMFGGAIAGSTKDYLQFILPGIVVQSVLFTTVYSGVALNTDMTRGVVDRFRSLPLWRPAPLVGAVAGDSIRAFSAGAVVVVLGLILGFRPDGGVLGVLGAILVVLVFAFALAWVFTTLGLVMRSPSAVMNTGFMALFPLIFLSNIFVAPETLPAALEAFVDVNPITHLVTATRGLMDGNADGGDIALVLGEAALLTAIFIPLTSRYYRKAG
ncbi:ABC transporter permease [Conexibacter arvalis]|uniref:Transport permease protein n=1 Tax=Conexibacter arvalis TaxID=912552 RepID=A0A840IF66_9ACTN|nr:ABC transporter permease [Conexibacter arvalis]MBB4663469.1 ABC-2 type transport system permease protein [Conexibacter arvalis]